MISLAQKIMNRIRRHGRGWVFTPRDFVDLASRSNVDTVLHRLAGQGDIRHFARGLYDYPRKHPKLGNFPPHAPQAAAAIARATGDRIYPTGAQAANRLGLTTQVPADTIYVTTGKSKDIVFSDSGFTIHLQKAKLPKTLTHQMAYMALQALDNLGPRMVDRKMIDTVAKILAPDDKKDIQANLRYIRNPWLMNVARQLTA